MEDQNQHTQTPWQYNPGDNANPAQPDSSHFGGVPMQQLPEVSWTASEYIAHKKSGTWFGVLGGGAIGIAIIMYLITQDVLSAVVILVVALAIGVFGARQPNTMTYILSEDGIHIGDKYFPYQAFKSFAIQEEGAIESIWLRPLKRFMMPVTMYFAPQDGDRIVDMLSNFLPQEIKKQDLFERMSSKVRF